MEFANVLSDMERGTISIQPAYRMITATFVTRAQPSIRVSHNDRAQFKLALAAHARNIVVPVL